MDLSKYMPAILAGAATLDAAAMQALKTDTLNEWLVAHDFKAIPKTAIPWISVGLGVAAAGILAAQNHTALDMSTVIDIVTQGLGIGGLGVLAHELFGRKAAQ